MASTAETEPTTSTSSNSTWGTACAYSRASTSLIDVFFARRTTWRDGDAARDVQPWAITSAASVSGKARMKGEAHCATNDGRLHAYGRDVDPLATTCDKFRHIAVVGCARSSRRRRLKRVGDMKMDMKMSVRWIRLFCVVVLCALGLSSPAAAQFGVGAIGGTVTDESGGVLPGVTVTLSNPGVIGGDQSAVSDGNGAYQFSRLVPGTYTVKAELQGFNAVVQPDITVNADRTSRADLKLKVGNVEETVTVSGQTPLLDTRSALNQTVLARETLDTIPTGYDTWSIARLAPAIHLAKY